MKKILIFSGTTEGKRLAKLLSEAGICCTVCVATEYGELVMPDLPGVTVHRGRMNADEMHKFIENGAYAAVVDATHPFAVEVTENIRKSVEGMEIPYLRLRRDLEGDFMTHIEGDSSMECSRLPEFGEERARTENFPAKAVFSTSEECARALARTEGNILLTTGSKELSVYAAEPSVRARLYVRVLPSEESIRLCRDCGIEGKQIIAMQGPFSEEMNEALLKQYAISCMVTKESGSAGGFPEKCRAAQKLGVKLFVIGSPREEGLSFEEVCEALEKLTGRSIEHTTAFQISLIGIGMGNPDTLTQEAARLIRESDVLFGASRMLAAVNTEMTSAERKPIYLSKDILPALREMNGNKKIAIVFSGDTGFYSGCRKLYRALAEAPEFGNRWQVRVVPGISGISYLAAALGQSWQDARTISLHGREAQADWSAELLEAVRFHEKTYLIVSGVEDVQKIGRLLGSFSKTDNFTVYVGYQLSYPEEQILALTPQQCEAMQQSGLYTCLIVNRTPEKKPATHGIADDAFIRDTVPMTKEEIRIVSICKLHLQEDSVVYDVGSGTGSIAVEVAARSGKIRVFAIEKKPQAAALSRKNAAHFHVPNVTVVEGNAPEILKDLPVPTHAFIGGSSGNLREILNFLYEKNPEIRVVINAVSLETISEITEILPQLPLKEQEVISLSVSRSRPVGQYHLMQAENPIYIAAFTFSKERTEHWQ
jgi:precorrin-6Y C5,15-methyltransferase (decarboxylating)